MQKVAVRFSDWVDEVQLIVSSPYVRARQTADIISQFFDGAKVVEAPELVPQSPPQAFLNWLKAHGREFNRVIVVGHEPHLSSFMCYLISGKDHSFADLKKSGAASLEVESFMGLAPGNARLNWLIQPKLVMD